MLQAACKVLSGMGLFYFFKIHLEGFERKIAQNLVVLSLVRHAKPQSSGADHR